MGDKSNIEWTEATWNSTTGCDIVSPGCKNCYAKAFAPRLKAFAVARGAGPDEPYMRDGDPRTSGPGFGYSEHIDRLDIPLRWKRPRRIFTHSMSDPFHENATEPFLLATWAAMEAAPQHTYQMLTKRPDRMRAFLSRGDQHTPPTRGPMPSDAPVPGFPGYVVRLDGTITGPRGVLTPDTNKETGHQRVVLYRDGERTRRLVHHVVLEAFGEPRPSTDAETRHLNGDASDNRLDNLAWGPQEHNWADRIAHGHEQSYTKITWRDVFDMRVAGLRGESGYAIAQRYAVSDTQVRNVLTGRHWAPRPRPWIWLGTSVENARWRTRIDELRQTTAAVRFLSCEPLLGPLVNYGDDGTGGVAHRGGLDLDGIDWAIVGGESGPNARPMDERWVRDIIAECRRQGVLPFVKQLGTVWAVAHGQGRSHGGDWDKGWPDDLRVREMPSFTAAVKLALLAP